MRIKLTIEIEVDELMYNDIFGSTEEEKQWFENEILSGNGDLLLHSNEIGDTIGVVKKVSNIKYIKDAELESAKIKCTHTDTSFVGTIGAEHCHLCGELIDLD